MLSKSWCLKRENRVSRPGFLFLTGKGTIIYVFHPHRNFWVPSRRPHQNVFGQNRLKKAGRLRLKDDNWVRFEPVAGFSQNSGFLLLHVHDFPADGLNSESRPVWRY